LRTIPFQVNSLSRKVDGFVGSNRFVARQAFLPALECPCQSCLKGALNPETKVKVIPVGALEEEDPFQEDHMDTANV
jgi:hypothetical protein